MAEISLTVSKKSISEFFKIQGRKYVIPEYQRPYKWDKELCETLWSDITDFFDEENKDKVYFLGSIVTCKGGSDNEIEIIDGQQRVTSLFLLLRAFYRKLEEMQNDKNIAGLKNDIAPCIWDVDRKSKEVVDKDKMHIESRVATESDNEEFHLILKQGVRPENGRKESLYISNYSFFYEKCEEYAKREPTRWQDLCVTILDRCIILPIECESAELALTIFHTLNDRGMPLCDSDIFKAHIYKTKQSKKDKKFFTDRWKELTEQTEEEAEISLDVLFRYYTHIIRAKNGIKEKEEALRKFYQKDNYARLIEPALLEDLFNLSEFWIAINTRGEKIGDAKKISFEASKYLHCLEFYPNEYWKYIVSVFFYKNKDTKNFISIFPDFLKKLTAFLFAKFIEQPSVNAIKDDIYKGMIDIFSQKSLSFSFEVKSDLKESISKTPSWRISKALLLLYAYQNPKQKELIPEKFEIEHILPKAWQSANYNGWSREAAEESIEKYGNKVVIEKKKNIQAGNKYFGKKKVLYKTSKIAEVLDLGKYRKDDWAKDDIEKREEKFRTALFEFFEDNLS